MFCIMFIAIIQKNKKRLKKFTKCLNKQEIDFNIALFILSCFKIKKLKKEH